MIGLELDQAIPVFARITTLAAAYGIDAAALLDRLTAVAPEVSEEALITVPGTFDRIAVGTRIARGNDGVDRVRVLSSTCDATQPARLEQLARAETRDLWVEIESVPHDLQAFAITVSAYGKRVLSSDLGRLAGFGVPGELIKQLDELTTTLVGRDKLIGLADRADTAGARTWTIQVAHRNADAQQRAATVSQIRSVATTLGVTEAQRNVVIGLHDTFAAGRDSYSWLRVREHKPGIELGVLWSDVAWEHVVNMMLSFYPNSGASIRLGELAGAFGADAAAGVELELGSTSLPGMRISVTLTKGRSQS